MIESMAATLAMWLLLAACFVGLGSGIVRLSSGHAPRSLARTFWIGWSSWIALLQGIHFATGLATGWTTALLCVVGVAGLLFERARIAQSLKGFDSARSSRWPWLAAGMAFALMLANRAQGPLLSVDSGLYHLTAIKWAAESPLTTGLGNLHGRLAFNNASFLWLASLDAWPDWFRGYNVGPSLLVLAAIAHLVRRFTSTKAATESMFHAILVVPLIYAATVMHVSSTGPDWVVLVIGAVLASELWGLLSCDARDESSERFLGIAALSAAGIAIKLSFAVLGVAAIAIAAGWGLQRHRSDTRGLFRALVPGLALAALLAITWSVRSVVLSGYPAYPSSFAAQEVSWRVPTTRVDAEMQWIRSWARAPGKPPAEVLGNARWFRPWLSSRLRNSDSVALLVIPGAMLALALVFGALRRTPMSRVSAFVALPSFVSIVAWFSTAPDPRFLGAAVWVCASAALTNGALHTSCASASNRFKITSWIGATALLAFAGYMTSFVGGVIIRPGRDDGRYAIRHVETKAFRTETGLTLHVPRDGDACWEEPLPCTPYPAPRLGLRIDDDPSSGFELK